MSVQRLIWGVVAVTLSVALLVVYPYQGILLAVMAGGAYTGVLYLGALGIGARRLVGRAAAAATAGPAVSLAGSGSAAAREAFELSLGAVLVVGAVGMNRYVHAAPGRTSRHDRPQAAGR